MGVNSFSELSKLNIFGDKDIKRGDIFYIQDSYSSGSEQRAGRPAVIVSSDKGVKTSPVVSIIYLTTEPKPDMMVHVDIRSVARESIALCEQVFTVSKNRVGDYYGHVTASEMSAIELGIAEALGIRYGISQETGIQFIDTLGEDIIEKANDHVRNVLSAGEEVRTVIQALKEVSAAEIMIGPKSIDNYVTDDIRNEIRQRAINSIEERRLEVITKLEKLMGIRKPATINPVFEAAVQEMVQQNNQKTSTYVDNSVTDPVELLEPAEKPALPALDDTAVEDVRRMYQSEGKTLSEVAAVYGVTKNQVNTYVSKHNLRRTSYKKDEIFLDAKAEVRAGRECL